MAMLDYGALVIKNGIPVNKNCGLFMDAPDYFDDEVKGNYFAYCGDEEYSLCFYNTLKYSATWEYKGDKWEVIFGYGIEPDEDVFNDITSKGLYNYGEESIKYIRERFFGGIK